MTVVVEPEKIAGAEGLDPDLRALLDHIAVELATEYIRLMETAANPEDASSSSATDA